MVFVKTPDDMIHDAYAFIGYADWLVIIVAKKLADLTILENNIYIIQFSGHVYSMSHKFQENRNRTTNGML